MKPFVQSNDFFLVVAELFFQRRALSAERKGNLYDIKGMCMQILVSGLSFFEVLYTGFYVCVHCVAAVFHAFVIRVLTMAFCP